MTKVIVRVSHRNATLNAMTEWMHTVLQWLALPEFGLSTVFVVALISATLLPMGSEPAVFGLVKLARHRSGHDRQHPGRHDQLVDGVRRTPCRAPCTR